VRIIDLPGVARFAAATSFHVDRTHYGGKPCGARRPPHSCMPFRQFYTAWNGGKVALYRHCVPFQTVPHGDLAEREEYGC